jgi:hypothetical protein
VYKEIMPNLIFLGVPDPTNRIPVMRALREVYGFGLAQAKRVVMDSELPHELPELPVNAATDAYMKLTAAGAKLGPFEVEEKPDTDPKDFFERLDEDLF